MVAGVLAINENNRVKDITERALSFDIEVEDEASDAQVAVLDLRHIHRNIVFSGTSESTIADFDDAYTKLEDELGELESLGLSALGVTQPSRIRELAERYYADFRPAIERAGEDPGAFQTASDIGLSRLARWVRPQMKLTTLVTSWRMNRWRASKARRGLNRSFSRV